MIGQNYLRCSLIDNPKRQPYGEENSFNPIPLTPEVLEKNGFEFLIDTWYLQTEERKPIHIRFMDEFIAISINCNIIPMGLKYVHQLQHALRLCGIEKEIEL